MTRVDREAGYTIIEMVVALAVMLVLFPVTAAGASAAVKFLVSVTEQSATQSTASNVLTTLTMQINGAQPIGYCPDAPGAAVNQTLELTTPVSDCANIGQGPPTGIAPTNLVPEPAGTSCPQATVGPSSVFAATATCIGFFSYDYEGSIADLSINKPLNPPEAVWVWQGGGGAIYATYYPPAATATYTDPSWAATARRRYIGTDASTAPFSFYGQSNTELGAPIPLPSIQTIGISGTFTFNRNQSIHEAIRVMVSGNVYQAQTQWNTTT